MRLERRHCCCRNRCAGRDRGLQRCRAGTERGCRPVGTDGGTRGRFADPRTARPRRRRHQQHPARATTPAPRRARPATPTSTTAWRRSPMHNMTRLPAERGVARRSTAAISLQGRPRALRDAQGGARFMRVASAQRRRRTSTASPRSSAAATARTSPASRSRATRARAPAAGAQRRAHPAGLVRRSSRARCATRATR